MGAEKHGEAHGYWLARTKVRPPRQRADLIPRERLLSELRDSIISHALTLVSTPAGYGKTTVLAALPHAFPDLSTAWLSLDQEDNEPACFLAALVAALQNEVPGCASGTQSLLNDLPNPGAEARRVIGALVNDVMKPRQAPWS